MIEYGYPVGTVNWTGDDGVLFAVDSPDFGGFLSSVTIVKADWWRMGQLKAGNKLRFHRISYEDAIAKRKEVEEFLGLIEKCCQGKSSLEDVFPLQYQELPPSAGDKSWGKAVVHEIREEGSQPLVTYRQGG